MTKLYDITPPISPRLGVWPGDTPASREILLEIEKGATVTLSTLRATVHLGAHVDAPNHYVSPGQAIEQRSLDFYLGPCQVIRVEVPRGRRVMPEMLTTPLRQPRVLLNTGTFADPTNWNNDFAALSPELVDFLHEHHVRLIGIDTPSVDLMDDKLLLSHKRIASYDMAILEGIVLRDVPEGEYELIALPLPLVGFDASPVRAVLRSLPSAR